MFERFTVLARRVVVLAQHEARALKHGYVGSEHILLGLLGEQQGLAARVLESFGVSHDGVHDQVIRIVGPGEVVTEGAIPFTPRSKKILELALREALALGHNYIGTEHILLGLVRENEGVATRVLLDFNASAEKIRDAVIAALPGSADAPPEGAAGMPSPGDLRFVTAPDSELRRLLMAAAANALMDSRNEFGLADFLAVLNDRDDNQPPTNTETER